MSPSIRQFAKYSVLSSATHGIKVRQPTAEVNGIDRVSQMYHSVILTTVKSTKKFD
jgi:hypothetical protein